MTDPQRFRVNLLCSCNNDLAYGYGATIEEARTNAQAFFYREHIKGRPRHGRPTVQEEIIERVTDDGTHYEEFTPTQETPR